MLWNGPYVLLYSRPGCQGEHITSNTWSHKCNGRDMNNKACTLGTPFRSMQMRGGYLPFEPEPVSNIMVSVIARNETLNLTSSLNDILNVKDIRQDVNLKTRCPACKIGVDVLGIVGNIVPFFGVVTGVVDIVDDVTSEEYWKEDVEKFLDKIPNAILNATTTLTKKIVGDNLLKTLKVNMRQISDNTKSWIRLKNNETADTETEKIANMKTYEVGISNIMLASFSLMDDNYNTLLFEYPELVVEPLFTLCSTMNLFLSITPDGEEGETNLLTFYKKVIKNLRSPLIKERLNKITVHKKFEKYINDVKELPYNPYGYIDPNVMWNCTNLYDPRYEYLAEQELRDAYDKGKADYEHKKTMELDSGLRTEGLYFRPDVYVCDPLNPGENFAAYIKWVRTRYEYAYDTVCSKRH
ncbi:hypothetical protein WDU94_010800 [Cyamophila willieti]